MSIHQLADYGILVSFIIGSVGFVASNIEFSRSDRENQVFRWMRNLGTAATMILIVVRAFT